jgi:hypothetical protein
MLPLMLTFDKELAAKAEIVHWGLVQDWQPTT